MSLAPIILFCYNRPLHTEKVLIALSKNVYADESVLYIYCDGPKSNSSEEQLANISEVRKVIRSQQWCKEVIIKESSVNKGLANSVISGVTEVIKEYDKVIVLEDDLVTSPYFLKYMNEALDFYQDKKSVFSISANRPPKNKMDIPEDYSYDVFVSLRNYCTGWGTWKDRWLQVDWKLSNFDLFLNSPELIEAYNRGGDDLTPMMLLQQEGKIDSWALRFGYAHFVNHAVSILPCISYIDNIGFDGSGVHSGVDYCRVYRNPINEAKVNPRFLSLIYEDKRIINSFYNGFCLKKRPLWQKGINWCCRKLSLNVPFKIKKRIYH